MLDYFLVVDIPTKIALLAPLILWFTALPRWRPLIAVYAVIVWGILGIVMWVRYRRRMRAEAAAVSPRGDWRWPADLPSERYAQRLRLYLHNLAWPTVVIDSVEPDCVTYFLQKDRLQVLMRCRRTETPPDEAEIAALSARKAAKGAGMACLMLPVAVSAADVANAAAEGVQVMRLEDMADVDDPDGPAGFAPVAGR